MPGVHPSSRKQVRFAFAAERRGELPSGTAVEWSHRWKCWTTPALRRSKKCRKAYRDLSHMKSR